MKIVINLQYLHNSHLKTFIENLPKLFDENDAATLYDKRNVIKSFNIDYSDNVLQSVVIKRYHCPNIFQRIAYSFFRQSKARRAYQNAETLLTRGFSTPINIAYVEQWKNGLFKYGFYLTGFDGAHPICEQLNDKEDFNKIIASDFAAFAAELHAKGILHGDLNSTNVLFHPLDNGHYSFSVIDINRMTTRPSGDFTPNECFDNLTRFTGRMDLFEYVLKQYIIARNWDVDKCLPQAIAIKKHHDEQWRKRKAFTGKIKKIF